NLPKEEIDRRVRAAAKFVGIDEDLFEKSPFELSGGQKRRVAIAGIMAMEPEIIVLDEPAAGLDPRGRDEIFNGIKNWQQSHNATVILISHSMEDMALYADDIVVMSEGGVLCSGSVDEVFCKTDLIEKSGLALPQITAITDKLTDMGLISKKGIYTVEEAYLNIKKAIEA
ncbi:MAG: ATP-binding cassette domain-containing protein, partial [Ruminococcaceae bacterium]|nr:ATP-binding cassette domain-containing protein [Oscillospiraceae bacterium]